MRLALSILLPALLSSACGGGDPSVPTTRTIPAFVGADISALERIEQAGGVFRSGGQAGDAIAILRGRGATGFRLRLFLNPDYSEVQVNDLPYTVRMATRIKAAGAKLLLDFHYSDTWADPGQQVTPAAWAALGIDSLEAHLERYSDSVITALKQAGALPDIVQIGNEVDGGMLWPLGALEYDADSLASWDRFTRLLRAGIRGVRSALAPADSVRIMVHYSQGTSIGGTRWFFDHVQARGVDFDLIGLSYYPWWHGALPDLAANLQATAARFGRDVMVVEAAYPWRAGGWEGMVTSPAAMTWPVSQQGQAEYLSDVTAAVAAVPGGRGAGVVWWYPESIQVPGVFVWAGGSLALFDASGNVLPAAGVFTP